MSTSETKTKNMIFVFVSAHFGHCTRISRNEDLVFRLRFSGVIRSGLITSVIYAKTVKKSRTNEVLEKSSFVVEDLGHGLRTPILIPLRNEAVC